MKKTEMMPTPCNNNNKPKGQTVVSSLDNLYDDQCSALSSLSFLTQKANKKGSLLSFIFYVEMFEMLEMF